jgi:hypothetical protein
MCTVGEYAAAELVLSKEMAVTSKPDLNHNFTICYID